MADVKRESGEDSHTPALLSPLDKCDTDGDDDESLNDILDDTNTSHAGPAAKPVSPSDCKLACPVPWGTLPPRKRAKTKDEKEQRRVERIMRNRQAAHASREKKRKHVEELEKQCAALVQENQRLVAENQKSKAAQLDMLEQQYLLMARAQQLQALVPSSMSLHPALKEQSRSLLLPASPVPSDKDLDEDPATPFKRGPSVLPHDHLSHLHLQHLQYPLHHHIQPHPHHPLPQSQHPPHQDQQHMNNEDSGFPSPDSLVLSSSGNSPTSPSAEDPLDLESVLLTTDTPSLNYSNTATPTTKKGLAQAGSSPRTKELAARPNTRQSTTSNENLTAFVEGAQALSSTQCSDFLLGTRAHHSAASTHKEASGTGVGSLKHLLDENDDLFYNDISLFDDHIKTEDPRVEDFNPYASITL